MSGKKSTTQNHLADGQVKFLSEIASRSTEELIHELKERGELDRKGSKEYSRLVDVFSSERLKRLLMERIRLMESLYPDHPKLSEIRESLPTTPLAVQVGEGRFFVLEVFYRIVDTLNNLK